MISQNITEWQNYFNITSAIGLQNKMNQENTYSKTDVASVIFWRKVAYHIDQVNNEILDL